MTTAERDLFRARLVSAVTTADRRESAREAKRPNGRVNIYRIGHYLKAANEVMARIDEGATPEGAFTAHFTPTAYMHTAAKKLGLAVTVENGKWVVTANPAPKA